jgi:allantoicase
MMLNFVCLFVCLFVCDRRRRGPGFDWVIIQLGVPGTVKKLEIDTAHFKGNFPHSCSVEGAFIPKDLNPVIALGWHQLLPKSLLQVRS